ncbi:MAG: hypothetical protein EOM20_01820 [Spartobacteria bacterium]|nr:hypothetical protein [Spartobacteria bacterium]
MKIGPWHRMWLAIAVALLVFMFIFPHYSVRERISSLWAYRMERVDNDYERNMRNLRSLKNYSRDDVAREIKRRRTRQDAILRQQQHEEQKLQAKYLGEYYVVALLIWLGAVGVLYGLGWLVYYVRLDMGLPPPRLHRN